MVRAKKFTLPDDMAAYLSAASKRRVKARKLCAECGAEFVGITKALYCSPRCRVKAHYYRTKASDRRTPPPPPAATEE